MRNPKRIPVVCNELSKIWLKYPDWRLGQIFSNLQSFVGKRDIFFMEEDEILRYLKEIMK